MTLMNSKRMVKLAGLIKEGREDNERYEKADTVFGKVNVPIRKNDKPVEPKPIEEEYDGGPGPFGDEEREYLAKGELQAKKDKDPVGFRFEELEDEILTLRDRVKTLEMQVLDLTEQSQK